MFSLERARIQSEQRLALRTWLLEGHPPVAHMTADLDELEGCASTPSRHRRRNWPAPRKVNGIGLSRLRLARERRGVSR